jgi:hypothetical protein
MMGAEVGTFLGERSRTRSVRPKDNHGVTTINYHEAG